MSVDPSTLPGPRPPAPLPTGSRPSAANIAGTIRKAAQTTGASFEYLLATAKVESNLNPNLTMKSSSATGLFQFIEQTWLGVMKQAGKALGYGRHADAIQRTSTGRYLVKDPTLRSEIMRLRKDPAANAVMAGVFTRKNEAALANRIGRAPNEGELYIAHFFGPGGAARLIRTADANPQANASGMFPAAARANKSIFFDKQGNARSVAGVYGELVRRYQVARANSVPGATTVIAAGEPAAAPGATQPTSDPAGITSVLAAANSPTSAGPKAPVFHSMFQTEGRRGAVAPMVAELWGAPAAQTRAAEAETAFGPPAAPAAATAPTTSIAPTPATAPASPLELFQETRPKVRSLFGGPV